ncbi:transcriptional regulator [Syntrophothermus lipocalidus]|uniref:Uncharacterized protein n=1 Tax=Syntrophothermus lipocalidus (strain DSM 12680 / TGB-C1) TaxID=643648 RepID=D7CIR4_SYNLT|nr:transcriptional regulator [Syntrophothermus lipocalidus]ADI02792.1 hypothetical protein Slip_2045 [Syntrophothermus lipocalidus DSM 12680]
MTMVNVRVWTTFGLFAGFATSALFQLIKELGTQEKAAERLGWSVSNVSYYKAISELPDSVFTVIRKSVKIEINDTVKENFTVVKGRH